MNYFDSSKQIKIGAILSYIAIVFEVISGLIYTPWMIKQIGASDYALFSLAASFIVLFAMDFGLGAATTRYLSKFKAQGDKTAESKFLGIAFKLYIFLSIIIFIILLIMYFFIENIFVELTLLEIEKLKIVYIIFGLFTVISFNFLPFKGILASNERFVFNKILKLSCNILNVVLMVIVLLLGYGLYAMVLVRATVGILKIVAQYLYINTKTITKIAFRTQEKALYKEIFNFSVWTTTTVIAQRFILNITPALLGILSGSMQIAIFSIAMKLEAYTFYFANAIGGLFLPMVSRMIYSNHKGDVEELNIKVGRIQLFIVGLLVVGFISLGQEFMYLWMGNEFSDAYLVVVLLILPSIITYPLQIADTTMTAMNKIKYNAFASLITALISFSMSWILCNKYGAIGAGIAILMGNILGKIVYSNIIYHKILNINMFRFYKACHIKIFLPLVITMLVGYSIQYFTNVSSYVYFFY